MFAKIVTISCLVAAVHCANFPRGPHAAQSQLNPQAVAAPGSPADAAAKAAAQQAKLHYVEIGPSLKGDYKFGYDTGSGPAGQSFREETRLDDGTVKGAYGYVDANGKQRIVKYTAGKNGFVVEGDQEAPGSSGAAAPARPSEAPARRPQPVPQPSPAQPSFDEGAPVAINRAPASSTEDRALAERAHAEQLRQHQLAHQADLAQQQQVAQRLQAQQQQLAAAEAARQRAEPQQAQLPARQFGLPQQQAQQHAPLHQTIDPQTGSFFSSSSEPNIQNLFNNQFRQLQSANQFGGQFQPPAPPQQHQPQQQQFVSQPSPAFQQPAQQFASPQDFNQLRAARQVPSSAPTHQQQPQQPAGAQSALLALHQQQQHDAQLLANLRAQHLARVQEQAAARQAPPAASAPAPSLETAPRHQHQQPFGAAPQQHAQAQPQFQRAPVQAQHAQPMSPQSALAPQQENFGPPVIDIRTLNYSIGQQTRV